MDNETLIALVASLLTNVDYTETMILEALIAAEGDVTKAAHKIQNTQPPSARKRKFADIKEWVTRGQGLKAHKRHAAAVVDAGSKQSAQPSQAQSSPTAKASSSKTTLNAVIPHTTVSPGTKPVRLPPLLLSNAAMVKEHTPCTLHHSILPPELASRLFYVMSDLSNHWKRNKWWLFDRVVESPHLTSFFARRTNGLDDNEDWQQAAQFWYNFHRTSTICDYSR